MDNRYYGSYRRYTFDWDYADQEEYTRYEDELHNLELKEVISDEEYNNNVSRLEALNDMEELEKYRNDYVSESEYFFSREDLINSMNEIETRYRVTEEMKQEDRMMRARFTRDRLKMIKKTYEAREISNTITGLDVDNLSDEEVISMYAYATRDKSPEEIRDLELGSIRARVNGYVPPVTEPEPEPTPIPVSRDDDDVTLTEIENELNIFRDASDRINNQMNDVNRKLILDDMDGLNVSETIDGLAEEINELREMGRVILNDMDNFRLETEAADFSMSPSEVNNKIKEFTNRFKELKVLHQAKYNARVDYINSKIDELKAMTDLDDEVMTMIDGLTKLDRSDKVVKSWTQKNYLNNIDYNRLVEVNKQIDEIQNRLGKKTVNNESVEGLEDEMFGIEIGLNNVESEIGVSDVEKLKQDLDGVNSLITGFEQKLELNKDSLSEEEYNAYKKRVMDAKDKLDELSNKLGKNVVYSNDYKELDDKLGMLSHDVDSLDKIVSSLHGHIVESGKLSFEASVDKLGKRYDKLVEELESKKDNMDPNQYHVLRETLDVIENKIISVSEKVKDPAMIKDADIFALLNGEIDGLESALTNLEEQVEKLDKPIKKDARKDIDRIVKHLEKEIARLSNLVEHYKEENEDKYNSSVERLNGLKDRLDKVEKKYRSKCPLMVKTVKSAKNFFKKHKKVCLIVAGLSAMALVSYHVLIPAIMHGNIMISGTTPALRPFMKFTNGILGGMIGAEKKLSDGVMCWFLANGVRINPSCASSSLLKGLAISGVNSTLLVAPLVVAIKKLVEKMKTTELKQKLSESLEKGKETIKNTTDKAKQKVKNVKPVMPKNYDKLCNEFMNSEMSLEEFCKEKELNEKEKEIIELKAKLIDVMKENKKNGRRGK